MAAIRGSFSPVSHCFAFCLPFCHMTDYATLSFHTISFILIIAYFSFFISHIYCNKSLFFVSLSTCGLPFHVAWAKRSLVRVTLLFHFSGLVRFIYELSKITPYTFTDSIVPSRNQNFSNLMLRLLTTHKQLEV